MKNIKKGEQILIDYKKNYSFNSVFLPWGKSQVTMATFKKTHEQKKRQQNMLKCKLQITLKM